MPKKKWVSDAVTSILARTRSYFEEEFGIAVSEVGEHEGKVETLTIHGLTAIIGFGGPVSLLVAFSFAPSLVDALYERMAAEIDVPPGEESVYRGYLAADIVNVIVGNCTADFQHGGQPISLTPPMIIECAKNIHRMKNAMFISRSLQTKFGFIDVNLLGPSELFDKDLNYLE